MKIKIFLIVAFLLLACPAWSATYYVCSSGCSDDNNGTSTGQCVASITRAHALAGSTDTVNFCPSGTWTASGYVLNAESGVTYIGNDSSTWGSGTRAILRATGIGEARDGVVTINVDGATVRGFELDVNEQAVSGVWIGGYASVAGAQKEIDDCVIHDTGAYWHYGIIVGGGSNTIANVLIRNSTVYNFPHEGITLYPGNDGEVSNVTVRGCVCHDVGELSAEVCMHNKNNTHDVVWEYNTVYNNVGGGAAGASLEGSFATPYNITFRYNIFYNNDIGIAWQNGLNENMSTNVYGNLFYNNGVTAGYEDIRLPGNSNINIYNNTIYNTRALSHGAIYASGSGGTINFVNNIVYTTNSPGVYDSGGYLTHSDNLIYRASGTAITDNSTNYTSAEIADWDNTAIGTDPAFSGGTLPTGFSGTYGTNMVPNTDYFQLTVDSPAKDAGATLASYTGAINGAGLATPIVRPLGAAYDIGAYEYGTVAQSGGSAGSGFKLQGVTIR